MTAENLKPRPGLRKMAKNLVPATPSGEMVLAAGVDGLLSEIRAEWRSKALIERVKNILRVDPSSACQRLLNAAIHDLRDKIIIAGVDVAGQAASIYKLPSVTKAEDVYEYSISHTLDLAYRMGLLSRPDWRRLKRAYDIRKDLEHEDDQYEAGVEDCVYVFRTCIEIVLSKDPITPVRVVDIKDIVESPTRALPSPEIVDEFEKVPDLRQVELDKFLISTSRNSAKPDIIRQNAIEALRALRPAIKRAPQAELGQYVQDLLQRQPIDLADAKIGSAAGVTPYLRQARVREFFQDFHRRMLRIGDDWAGYGEHGKLLDDFEDVGGLEFCPAEVRGSIVLWMVKCYIGEPGGYGRGINRPVFYSNTAAPRVEKIFRDSPATIAEDVEHAGNDKYVKAAIRDKHIARRLERLRDLVSPEVDGG